jgi:hypothetical protein
MEEYVAGNPTYWPVEVLERYPNSTLSVEAPQTS